MGPKKKGKGKGGKQEEEEDTSTEDLRKIYRKFCTDNSIPISKQFIKLIDDAEGFPLKELLINEKLGPLGGKAIGESLKAVK